MKKLKTILFLTLFALLGVSFGMLIAKLDTFSEILPQKSEMNWTYLPWLLLAYFLATFIHELGHLVTGLLQGFRFEYFVVGFFGLKRNEQGKIRPFFNTDMASFGGLAASSPTSYDNNVIDKFSNVLLAGPLASLLLSIYAFSAMFTFGQPLRIFHFFLGLMSAAIFLATTLPTRTGVFYTDRKRYQRLRSEGIEKDIELALMKANLLKLRNEPLTSMQEEELALLTRDDSAMFRYLGFFYLTEFHQNNPEKTAGLTQAMQALEPEIPKKLVAYFNKQLEAAAVRNVP